MERVGAPSPYVVQGSTAFAMNFLKKIVSCISEELGVEEAAWESTDKNGRNGIITLSTTWQYNTPKI